MWPTTFHFGPRRTVEFWKICISSNRLMNLGEINAIRSSQRQPINLGTTYNKYFLIRKFLGLLRASSKLRALKIPLPPNCGLRLITTWGRPKQGRPSESHVRRPIIRGFPIVMDLKCFKSSGIRQGNVWSRPIMLLSAIATMRESDIRFKLLLLQEYADETCNFLK